jgi:hypothetical protein
MPRDIENMPFGRSAPFQEGANERGTARDGSLRLESMLLEEFNYAGVTAYQAQEDRARMFNLYLLLIGVLGSALAAIYQIGGGLKLFAGELAIALLLVAGMMGVAFFTKLIRLRQAWRESVLAMSLVKEYYIREFSDSAPKAVHAFYWRLKTLPTGEKLTSTTAVVCATVATLGSLCFMGAAVVAGAQWLPLLLGDHPPVDVMSATWSIAIVLLVIILTLFATFYSRAFNRSREAAQTLSAAWRAELPVREIWDALRLNKRQCDATLDRLRDSGDTTLVAALTGPSGK